MKAAAMALGFLGTFMTAGPGVAQEAAATGALPYEATESYPGLVGKVDVGLILRSWRIFGIRTCPKFPRGVTTCVLIENAWPVGLLEVVRRPLTTHLLEFSPALKAMAPARTFGWGSNHSPSARDGTALQFAETHAWTFSPELPGLSQVLPLAVPPASPYALSYLSELDGYFWRTGLAEWISKPTEMAAASALPSCSTYPRNADCAGNWGSYVPRIGFAVHPSEVIAAHLQALRAGRVAADPQGRIGLGPYPHEPRTGHYLQMVRPSLRPGVPIGLPMTRLVEAGALSPQGAYLFVHFGIFRECKGCMTPTLAEPRTPGL